MNYLEIVFCHCRILLDSAPNFFFGNFRKQNSNN